MSKQKRATSHGTKKLRGLKVRRYTNRMINFKKYLSVFPGAKESGNVCETGLNDILLNIMPNS